MSIVQINNGEQGLSVRTKLNSVIDFVNNYNDVFVTGGTYNNTTGTATFTNNTGGTFNVTGFVTGSTGGDIFVTGGTYTTGGTLTLERNDNNQVVITGLTEDLNNAIGGLAETDEVTIELDTVNNKIKLKDTVDPPTSGPRTFLGDVVLSGGLGSDYVTVSVDSSTSSVELYSNTSPKSNIYTLGETEHSFLTSDGTAINELLINKDRTRFDVIDDNGSTNFQTTIEVKSDKGFDVVNDSYGTGEQGTFTIDYGTLTSQITDGSSFSEINLTNSQTLLTTNNAGALINTVSLGSGVNLRSEDPVSGDAFNLFGEPTSFEIATPYGEINISSSAVTLYNGLVIEYDTDYSSQYTNRTLVDNQYVNNLIDNLKKGSFGITIDGGGSAITTGDKGNIVVPYDCEIVGWTILGDVTGSIVVDLWKDTYANYPPTVADTITGTEKPTLSSAIKNQDNTLTSWTTSVSAGDIIKFNVDSASTVQRVNIVINVIKN